MDVKLSSYAKEMVLACEAALDAGVFYNKAFCDYVVKQMGGYDCEPVLVETITLNFERAQQLVRKEAEERIKSSPRGHYVILEKVYEDAGRRYSTIVSAGNGEVAPGGSHDIYDEQPAGEIVLRRMVEYEIYCCRKAVEEYRRRERNIKALEQHGYYVGQVFRNYKVPGEPVPFSIATIVKIYRDSGRVELHLTKRGTSKKWETFVDASCIEERIKSAPETGDCDGRNKNQGQISFMLAA